MALPRNCALAACAICAGRGVGVGCKVPAGAWSAIRSNGCDGCAALDRPGGVFGKQRRSRRACGNADGNLHDDGYRNIYRHWRKHDAQRAGHCARPAVCQERQATRDQKTLIARSRGCEPTAISAVGGRGGVSPGWPVGKVFVRMAATSFDAVSTTSRMSPPGVSAQVTGDCPA